MGGRKVIEHAFASALDQYAKHDTALAFNKTVPIKIITIIDLINLTEGKRTFV